MSLWMKNENWISQPELNKTDEEIYFLVPLNKCTKVFETPIFETLQLKKLE